MINQLTRMLDRLLATRRRHRDRAELMDRAVNAVVAGTDPRIRAVSGYRKQLLPAVKVAVRYVEDIVDRIPGPIVLAPSNYGSDPTIHACFSSVEDLRALLARSAELHSAFGAAGDRGPARVYAFLAMQRQEKKVFAPAMEGDILKSDVAQTLVSFADRRVVEVASSGYLARRQLMRRAFIDLIASAMNHLNTLQAQRHLESKQQVLLKSRLQVLKQRRAGLEELIAGNAGHDQEIATIEQEMAQQQAKHAALPPQPARTLEDYLTQVAEVFANPAQHLPFTLTSIHLTRMNRQLAPGQQPDLNQIDLAEARNSRGDKLSLIAVSVPRDQLPPSEQPSPL